MAMKYAAFFVAVLLNPPAWAEEGPDAVMRTVAAQLQASGSLSSIVDYADWNGIYSRTVRGSGAGVPVDAVALKDLNRLMFSDPGRFARLQAAKLPPANPTITSTIEARMTAQVAEQNRRYASANIEVGAPSISGDRAEVEILSNARRTKVPFVKRGRWLLAEFPFPLPETDMPGAEGAGEERGIVKLP